MTSTSNFKHITEERPLEFPTNTPTANNIRSCKAYLTTTCTRPPSFLLARRSTPVHEVHFPNPACHQCSSLASELVLYVHTSREKQPKLSVPPLSSIAPSAAAPAAPSTGSEPRGTYENSCRRIREIQLYLINPSAWSIRNNKHVATGTYHTYDVARRQKALRTERPNNRVLAAHTMLCRA